MDFHQIMLRYVHTGKKLSCYNIENILMHTCRNKQTVVTGTGLLHVTSLTSVRINNKPNVELKV